MAKTKTLEEVVKLRNKQWHSWMVNSNTTRKVKLWLSDYLDTLPKNELYRLIDELCERVYDLDETIE